MRNPNSKTKAKAKKNRQLNPLDRAVQKAFAGYRLKNTGGTPPSLAQGQGQKYEKAVNPEALQKFLDGISAKALKVVKAESAEGEDGEPLVELIASTDLTDTGGDIMDEQALEQMRDAAVGKTIWLNHSYEVPEDVFGSVAESRIEDRELVDIYTGEPKQCKCLVFVIKVELASPRAAKTYEMIKNGIVRFGASIGVYVLEAEELDDGRTRIYVVFYIETSIVGIPANWQSWVQSAKHLETSIIPASNKTKRSNKPGLTLKQRQQKLLAIPRVQEQPLTAQPVSAKSFRLRERITNKLRPSAHSTITTDKQEKHFEKEK